MKRPVIIVGDSWVAGEWSGGDATFVTHDGIGEYFREAGHSVDVLYAPGKGNRHNINRLAEHLSFYRQSNPIILFVVSDPLRNYGVPGKEILNDVVYHGGLFELQLVQLSQDFVALNQLASQYNTTVYLIGGLGTVKVDVSTLPQLQCIVRSWPELLVGQQPQFHNFDWTAFGVWGKWQSVLAKLISPSDSIGRKVIDQMTQLTKSYKIFEHALFQPDGGHPNRQGHKILFDFIYRKLNL